MPSFKAGSRTGYHRGDGALLPLRSASSAAPRHRVERRRLPGRTPRARHRVGDAGRIERGSPALFSMARQLEIVLLPRHARGDVPMTSHEGSHWRRTASAPRDSVSGSSRAAARVANSRCPRCRRARPSASGAKRRRGPGTGILRLQDSANGTLEVPNRAMPPRAPDGQPRGRIGQRPDSPLHGHAHGGDRLPPRPRSPREPIQNQSSCPVSNVVVPREELLRGFASTKDEHARITAVSGDGPRPPRGHRTAPAGHDGVVAETPLDLPDEPLWLHPRVGSGGARRSSIPFGAVSRKSYSACGSAAAAAPAGCAAVAHEADLNGIAQSDAHGIELDLHAARLTGLRMNSMYRSHVPPIKRVSHSSIVSCDSRVPRSPMDPVVSDV